MYKFTYRNSTKDLWQMFMYYTYGSIIGVCNIIFTCAMIALVVALWGNAGVIFRCVMVLGVSLFTIIQPVSIWFRSKKRAETIDFDTSLTIGNNGIHIEVSGETQDVPWKKVVKFAKKPTLIVIYTDTVHGYVLTNRIMGSQKKELIKFIEENIKK